MATINLQNLQKVKKIYSRRGGQDYDLRFSNKTGRFTASNEIWERLDLETNGFEISRTPASEGRQVVLNVVPEDDAMLFSRRYTTNDDGDKIPMGKQKEFTAGAFRSMLNKAGLEEVTKFHLEPAGEVDGSSYFVVVAQEATAKAVEGTEDTEPEDVDLVDDDEDDDDDALTDATAVGDEDEDAADAVEEEEDPFAL